MVVTIHFHKVDYENVADDETGEWQEVNKNQE